MSIINNGEHYDDYKKDKATQKGMTIDNAKGKKVATLDNSPSSQGPRIKNSTISPHTPPPFNNYNEAESSSKEVNSKNTYTMEEVNEVPSIAQ